MNHEIPKEFSILSNEYAVNELSRNNGRRIYGDTTTEIIVSMDLVYIYY